jgi:uncharacterized membrane protein
MTFMHEGGMAMWATLIVFVGAAAASVLRRRNDGWALATLGAIACLASGLSGFATGMYNVVAYAERTELAQRADILGIGLREAVHNVLWAGSLALVLAVIALMLRARSAPAMRAA